MLYIHLVIWHLNYKCVYRFSKYFLLFCICLLYDGGNAFFFSFYTISVVQMLVASNNWVIADRLLIVNKLKYYYFRVLLLFSYNTVQNHNFYATSGHSRVDRENLVLRHSAYCPFFLEIFWLAEVKAVLCLVFVKQSDEIK